MSNETRVGMSEAGTEQPGLKPHQYDVLVAAVNIARERGIKSLKLLRAALSAQGHAEEDISAAVSTWSKYEASRAKDMRAAA